METIIVLLFSLTFLQVDEGCGLDPFGGCVGALSDTGWLIDPNGVRAFDGNGFDPHGVPRTTSGDEGCGVDPFGGCIGALSDHGPFIDPNGIRAFEGNGFDPHGAPRTGQYTGCVDPNGGCRGGAARTDDGVGIDPDGVRRAFDGVAIDPHGRPARGQRRAASGDGGPGMDPNG